MGYASRYTDEPAAPQKKDSPDYRVGMYPNVKVGKVIFVTSKSFDEKRHILIDVTEKCRNREGGWYDAHYNVWLWTGDIAISGDVVGQYCLFEYRAYSLRDKELNGVYHNYNKLKRFQQIDESEVERMSCEIYNSIKQVNL